MESRFTPILNRCVKTASSIVFGFASIVNSTSGLSCTNLRMPVTSRSRLLAGSGPSVRVKIVPAGAVTTEFVSEFSSAGINQTRHRIFLQVHTTVQMIIPTGTQSAAVSAHVPVAESIIVGDVPQSFVDVLMGEGVKGLAPAQ